MPVRIVPWNLVGLDFFHVVRNLRVEFRGQIGKFRAGLGSDIQISAASSSFLPCPVRRPRVFHEAVVAHDRKNVRSSKIQIRCQVETKRRETRLACADRKSTRLNSSPGLAQSAPTPPPRTTMRQTASAHSIPPRAGLASPAPLPPPPPPCLPR